MWAEVDRNDIPADVGEHGGGSAGAASEIGGQAGCGAEFFFDPV